MENASNTTPPFRFNFGSFILYLEWVIIIIYSLALVALALFQLEIVGIVGLAYLNLVWPILLGEVMPAKLAQLVELLYLAALLLVALLGWIKGGARNRWVALVCLLIVLANLIAFLYLFDLIARAG